MKHLLREIFDEWIRSLMTRVRRRAFRRLSKLRGPRLFVDLYEQLQEELDLKDLGDDQKYFDRIVRHVTEKGEADASSVLQLELLLINHVEGAELQLRLITLREHLQAMLTPEAMAMVQRSLVRNIDAATTAKLRSEARALAVRVHRRFIMVPVVEGQRTAQMKLLLWSIALLTVALLWWVHDGASWLMVAEPSLGGPRYLYVLAAYCGAVGGAVSVIRRLYQIEPKRESTLIWLSLQHGGFSIVISPVFGAVFALLLLMIVNAGVVSGSLFPTFACEFWRDGYSSWREGYNKMIIKAQLAQGWNPSGNLLDAVPRCTGQISQYAKLVLASFLAGWAERFVPDVLEKLASSNGRFWDYASSDTPRRSAPVGDQKGHLEGRRQVGGALGLADEEAGPQEGEKHEGELQAVQEKAPALDGPDDGRIDQQGEQDGKDGRDEDR